MLALAAFEPSDVVEVHVGVVCPCRGEVDLLGRVRGFVAVEDVEHDDGHVVASAGLVRLRDQRVGGILRVVVFEKRRHDVGVRDFVDEAVAAQQEPVAFDERQGPPVDLHVGFDAERAGDDVAARVGARLLVGDVAGRHELLHVAVVDRDTPQPTVAQQVGARVADVGEHERFRLFLRDDGGDPVGLDRIVGVDVGFAASRHRVLDDGDHGDRGAHAGLARVGDRRAEDVAVRTRDRLDDALGGRCGFLVGEGLANALHGERARHFAGFVAAHPVRDDVHALRRVQVVFVVGPDLPRVRSRTPFEFSHSIRPRRV